MIRKHKKPLKPLVANGSTLATDEYIPLVYNGGYTTMNGGKEPADSKHNSADENREDKDADS